MLPWAASPSGGERGSPSQIPLKCDTGIISTKTEESMNRAKKMKRIAGTVLEAGTSMNEKAQASERTGRVKR